MENQNEAAGGASQPPSRLDPQITGNVGLYYCCYRLSLMGWKLPCSFVLWSTTRGSR